MSDSALEQEIRETLTARLRAFPSREQAESRPNIVGRASGGGFILEMKWDIHLAPLLYSDANTFRKKFIEDAARDIAMTRLHNDFYVGDVLGCRLVKRREGEYDLKVDMNDIDTLVIEQMEQMSIYPDPLPTKKTSWWRKILGVLR